MLNNGPKSIERIIFTIKILLFLTFQMLYRRDRVAHLHVMLPFGREPIKQPSVLLGRKKSKLKILNKRDQPFIMNSQCKYFFTNKIQCNFFSLYFLTNKMTIHCNDDDSGSFGSSLMKKDMEMEEAIILSLSKRSLNFKLLAHRNLSFSICQLTKYTCKNYNWRTRLNETLASSGRLP